MDKLDHASVVKFIHDFGGKYMIEDSSCNNLLSVCVYRDGIIWSEKYFCEGIRYHES